MVIMPLKKLSDSEDLMIYMIVRKFIMLWLEVVMFMVFYILGGIDIPSALCKGLTSEGDIKI